MLNWDNGHLVTLAQSSHPYPKVPAILPAGQFPPYLKVPLYGGQAVLAQGGAAEATLNYGSRLTKTASVAG